jgi:hypothetical protein
LLQHKHTNTFWILLNPQTCEQRQQATPTQNHSRINSQAIFLRDNLSAPFLLKSFCEGYELYHSKPLSCSFCNTYQLFQHRLTCDGYELLSFKKKKPLIIPSNELYYFHCYICTLYNFFLQCIQTNFRIYIPPNPFQFSNTTNTFQNPKHNTLFKSSSRHTLYFSG